MNSETILIIILSIISFEFALDLLLEYLNLKNLNQSLPLELEGLYTHENYHKSIKYQGEHIRFGFITSTFSYILILFMLLYGGFGKLNELLNQNIANPLLLSLSFFGILFILSDLLNIPFSLYSTFSIEQRYGFNKMDLKTFFIDKLKGYLLAIIVGGVVISILITLIQYMGSNFWWVFWLVLSALMVFINMFYTSLIVPLFNKLTPLEEGTLKEAILDYCKKVNFPLDNLFVVDGSKRSSKANAYFSGIGSKKKIVLYDTLIKDHNTEELISVLAHEVGHFKRKHIILSLIISVLQIGIMLYIMSLMVFNSNLSMALGGTSNTIHLNLIAFTILYSPISTITGLFMNLISRKNEYEADDYAKNTYSPIHLSGALKKLNINHLSNLVPHPAYVFFTYSHPTLLQRLRNLNRKE